MKVNWTVSHLAYSSYSWNHQFSNKFILHGHLSEKEVYLVVFSICAVRICSYHISKNKVGLYRYKEKNFWLHMWLTRFPQRPAKVVFHPNSTLHLPPLYSLICFYSLMFVIWTGFLKKHLNHKKTNQKQKKNMEPHKTYWKALRYMRDLYDLTAHYFSILQFTLRCGFLMGMERQPFPWLPLFYFRY